MWRGKKVILVALLAIAVLAGSTTGVALAQTGNGDQGPEKTLLARVAEILGIDQQRLENAFAQAKREMVDEKVERFLQKAVEEDRLTQEEAKQYLEWWQARPDTQLPIPWGRFGPHRSRGGVEVLERFLDKAMELGKITQEEAEQRLERWLSRPDAPLPMSWGRPGLHRFQGHPFWGQPHQPTPAPDQE